MKPRTEDEILARAPLSAKLGDGQYAIPLLAVIPQREWRKKLFAELVPVLASFTLNSSGNMATGLTAALLNFPDKLCDLVFAYREYGFAMASLARTPGIKAEELGPAFLALLEKGPLEEASDFPRAEILANSTEEQIASAFSKIMAVAFPFMPQLATVTRLLRATASSPQ
jgi:hypothetical protein